MLLTWAATAADPAINDPATPRVTITFGDTRTDWAIIIGIVRSELSYDTIEMATR
jgi:hypothetical protein